MDEMIWQDVVLSCNILKECMNEGGTLLLLTCPEGDKKHAAHELREALCPKVVLILGHGWKC
eukprot:scaffold46018_cov34-Prasinocladus_malaysianus.AAC.1